MRDQGRQHIDYFRAGLCSHIWRNGSGVVIASAHAPSLSYSLRGPAGVGSAFSELRQLLLDH
eukprot:1140695-Pelagomonas_calceolata.AAC.1